MYLIRASNNPIAKFIYKKFIVSYFNNLVAYGAYIVDSGQKDIISLS